MRISRIACSLIVVLVGSTCSAGAAVRLATLFSDHAVLQQDADVPVWGWAESGEEVSVSLAGQTQTTKAGADGKWMVHFTKLKSGGPYKLTAQGKNTVLADDVLIGEVWLGSGQSNMAMPVNRAQDYEQEKAAANLPQLRMFKEESATATSPQADAKGKWLICTPDNVGTFSATLYFFGREIHKSLGVPVGLINSSVGGTPIEAWTSDEAQRAEKELAPFLDLIGKAPTNPSPEIAKQRYEKALAKWQEDVKKARAEKKELPKKPRDPTATQERKGGLGGLFNGKIAPLIPYAIHGAIWYQGEANSVTDRAKYYQYQLPALIKDWRAKWGSEFPFAWAQLPNFRGENRDWPTVREGMLKTLALPRTGMGINIDIGEESNIHPKNKQEVGRRLSLWALGTVYGQKVPSTSGPLPAGHEIRDKEIVLKFSHVDGGLVAKGGELKGFAIAGEDKQWKPAQARIAGETVVVSNSDVSKPVAVRYAWENLPACNLFNGAGLPASPFRTDDW